MTSKFSAIAVIGPTGIGKTSLSLEIAERYSAEIISVDSMQVYRYMDIGTAKATPEERARVTHYLIDIVTPDQEYHAGRFVEDCLDSYRIIKSHNNIPLLVGGTGLYLRALEKGLFESVKIPAEIKEALARKHKEKGNEGLFEELQQSDPTTAERIHANDTYRLLRALEIFYATGIPWSKHLESQKNTQVLQNILKIGLSCAREVLYQRINQRVAQMISQGLADEVRMLLDMGYHAGLKSMQSLGYKHLVNFISGHWSWDESIRLLARDTRHYAKRQLTWFKADKSITWFHPSQHSEIVTFIDKALTKT